MSQVGKKVSPVLGDLKITTNTEVCYDCELIGILRAYVARTRRLNHERNKNQRLIQTGTAQTVTLRQLVQSILDE